MDGKATISLMSGATHDGADNGNSNGGSSSSDKNRGDSGGNRRSSETPRPSTLPIRAGVAAASQPSSGVGTASRGRSRRINLVNSRNVRGGRKRGSGAAAQGSGARRTSQARSTAVKSSSRDQSLSSSRTQSNSLVTGGPTGSKAVVRPVMEYRHKLVVTPTPVKALSTDVEGSSAVNTDDSSGGGCDNSRHNVDEAAPSSTSRGVTSGSVVAEHGVLPSLVGGHDCQVGAVGGISTATAETTAMPNLASTTAIPHPPMILTGRSLARVSWNSNALAAQLRNLTAESLDTTSTPSLPSDETQQTQMPALAMRATRHEHFGSLESSTLAPTSTSASAVPASVAPTDQAVVVGGSALPAPPATTAAAAAGGSVTRPPTNGSPSRLSISSNSPCSGTEIPPGGRRAAMGRRHLRQGSGARGAVGHSFSSLSSSSALFLGASGLTSGNIMCNANSTNTNTNSNSNGRVEVAFDGGACSACRTPSRSSGSNPKSQPSTMPASEVAVFRPMLPTTLTTRRASQGSLCTVCSTSANGLASAPRKEKHTALPRVSEAGGNAETAPPSWCSATVEGGGNGNGDSGVSCGCGGSLPLFSPTSERHHTTATTTAAANARTAARATAASTLPVHACSPLPKVICAKDDVKDDAQTSGQHAGRSSPVPSSAVSSPFSTAASQHRPQCLPLLSRTVLSTTTITPGSPATPASASAVAAVSASVAHAKGKVVRASPLNGVTPMLNAFDIVGVSESNEPSPTTPKQPSGKTSDAARSPTASDTAASPTASAKTPSPAARLKKTARSLVLSPPAVSPPFLRTPTPLSVGLRNSSSTHSFAAKPKAPPPYGKAPPRPATTCSADRRLSAHLNTVAPGVLSPIHGSVDNGNDGGGGGFRPQRDHGYDHDANNTNSTSPIFAATARRVSGSLPASPTPAPLAPQTLAPPQLSKPVIVVVEPPSAFEAAVCVCDLETMTSPLQPPPPADTVNTARLVTPTEPTKRSNSEHDEKAMSLAAASAVPAASSASATPAVPVETPSSPPHKSPSTLLTDSLNSRSADGEPVLISTGSRQAPRDGASATAMPQLSFSSPTQLTLCRSSTRARLRSNDGPSTASDKAAEVMSGVHAELEASRQPLSTELASLLQNSTASASPSTFLESVSVLEDPSMYFGTSMHTQRFVSSSRLIPPRTPLNPSMTGGRGGSSEGTLSPPTRVVVAAAISTNAGHTAVVGSSGSHKAGSPVAAAAARSRPPVVSPNTSFHSFLMDDVTTAVLNGRADEGGAVAGPTRARLARNGRLIGALRNAAADASRNAAAPTLPSSSSSSSSSSKSSDERHGGVPQSDFSSSSSSSSGVAVASNVHNGEEQQEGKGHPHHSYLSVCSSIQRDDAGLKSNGAGNVLHAYPSIATFASNEPKSPHSRDAADVSKTPCQSQHHSSQDTTGTEGAANENAANQKTGRHSGQQTASATLRFNTVLTSEDLNADTPREGEAMSSQHASDGSRSPRTSHDNGNGNGNGAGPRLATQHQQRRSSTLKMLSQSAFQLSDRIRRSTQWASRRGSKSSESNSTSTHQTQLSSTEGGSRDGSAAFHTTSGATSMTLVGCPNTVSATQVFAEAPQQTLPNSTVRRDRVSQSPRQRILSQHGCQADARNAGSANSLTHTASVMSSTMSEEGVRCEAASPLTSSTKRKRSFATAVTRLLSQASIYGTPKSSAAAGVLSESVTSLTDGVAGGAAAVAANTASEASCGPAPAAPAAAPSTATTTSGSPACDKGQPTLLPQFPPTPISTSAQASEVGEHSGSSTRPDKSGEVRSGSPDSPVAIDATATPRLTRASNASLVSGGNEENSERTKDHRRKTAKELQAGEASRDTSEVETLPPQPFLSSFDEQVSSSVKANRLIAMASGLSSTPTPSSRDRHSLERSSRASTDIPLLDSEALHTRHLNSNTMSGSTNPISSCNSTQAPIPWRASTEFHSDEIVKAFHFDEASPLAPQRTPSCSVSVSSTTSSMPSNVPSHTSAVALGPNSAENEMSVITITKPVLSGLPSSRSPSLSLPQAFKSVFHGTQSKQEEPSLKTTLNTSDRASLVPPMPKQPSPPPPQGLLSRQPRGGHGLYAALQAHQLHNNTSPVAQLYAGQGQATYEHFNSTNCRTTPTTSNPFAVVTAIRPRPGSSRPGSSRPGSASHAESARPGSGGSRRPRPAEAPAPSTASLFRSMANGVAVAKVSGDVVNNDSSYEDTHNTTSVSGLSTQLLELPMPLSTTALPKATPPKSTRARNFSSSLVSAWVKAAQGIFASSAAGALLSLRVPLSSSCANSSSHQVVVALPSSGSNETRAVATTMPQPSSSSGPQRRRVFTSVLAPSAPMDATLLSTKGDSTHAAVTTTSSSSQVHTSHSFDSGSDTSGGSSSRWSAAQTVTTLGFATMAAGNTRSCWSLSSTSKRKWTSSMTSSHGSGAYPLHSNAPSHLLQPSSDSSSLFHAPGGGTPTSSPGSRRGFGGRKFAFGSSSSGGSSSNGNNNTGSSNNNVENTSSRLSPRKLHKPSHQRQPSTTTVMKGLNGAARVTSAESHRNGQVVLMDAAPAQGSTEPSPPPPSQQKQQQSRAVTPTRNHRVSLVSAGSEVDGSPFCFAPSRNSHDSPQTPQLLQHSQASSRHMSELGRQDAPREIFEHAAGRSHTQSSVSSRDTTSSEENWLPSVQRSAKAGSSGVPSAGRASLGVLPGFTPSTMSLVDLSALLSGEVRHSQPDRDTSGDAASPAAAPAAESGSNGCGFEAAAAAAAFASTSTSDSDSLQPTPRSLPHDESSARTILGNHGNALQQRYHKQYSASVPKHPSATTGAFVSSVLLPTLMNSTSLGSNNDGSTAAATGSGTHQGVSSPKLSNAINNNNNNSNAAAAAADAAADDANAGMTHSTAADAPLATANTSLSATLGSGPIPTRPTRSFSPPPALLSCEAAPALFTMGNGLPLLQVQDSQSLAVGRGAAPPFSLENDNDTALTLSWGPQQQQQQPRGNFDGEGLTNGNGTLLVDAAEPPPSSQMGTTWRRSSIAAGSPNEGAGVQQSLVSSASATATPGSQQPQLAPTPRRASRLTCTSSCTGSNAAIPAPPSTSPAAAVNGSNMRSRRVGSMLTAHNSVGGVLGLTDSGSPVLRSTLLGSSRHSSGVSDAMSENANTGTSSVLESSLLYVPPELRRGPEWRHLQQHIAHNIAQSHQRDAAHLASFSSSSESFHNHARGQAARFSESVSGSGEKRNSYRHFTTASTTATAALVSLRRRSSQAASDIAGMQNTAGQIGAEPTCRQQLVKRSHSTTSPHRLERGSGLLLSNGNSAAAGSARSRTSPHLRLTTVESLLNGEAPDGGGGGSSSTIPASATAQTLPHPPSLLPLLVTNVAAPHGESEDEPRKQLSLRTPRGSKMRANRSVDHGSNVSGDGEDCKGGLLVAKSSMFTAAGDGCKEELAAASQQRLSEDRRSMHEAPSSEETRSSVLVPHAIVDAGTICAANNVSSSVTRRSLPAHVMAPAPQTQCHEHILSGVPFITSESDDDDDMRRDGHNNSSSSSSKIKALPTVSDHAQTPGACVEKELVAKTAAGAVKVSNVDLSPSSSFCSAKFASTTPGAYNRQPAATAELAYLANNAPAPLPTNDTAAEVTRRLSSLSLFRCSSAGAIDNADKRLTSRTSSRFTAPLTRQEKLHVTPAHRVAEKGDVSEAAVEQQQSTTRDSNVGSFDRCQSTQSPVNSETAGVKADQEASSPQKPQQEEQQEKEQERAPQLALPDGEASPTSTAASPVHATSTVVLGTAQSPPSPPQQRSILSHANGSSLHLLAFSPLVPNVAQVTDGLQHSGGASHRGSTATTGAKAAAAGAVSSLRSVRNSVDDTHGSSLSHTGGTQRNSVVSFEEPLVFDMDPFSREAAQFLQQQQHAAELPGILESSSSTAATAGVAAMATTTTTTTTTTTSATMVTTPSSSGVVRSPPSGSPTAEGRHFSNSNSGHPGSPRPLTTTRKARMQTTQSSGAPAHAPNFSGRVSNSLKTHNASPTTTTTTPFLLPNCAMMSSFNLGSPSESTLTAYAASPRANYGATCASNAVGVSGPLTPNGGGASAAVGDSSLMSTMDEQHRTLMTLSAFSARQTPVAAPSLLMPGEGAEHCISAVHGNMNNNNNNNGIGAVASPKYTPGYQVISASIRRDGSGRGRPTGDAVMLPRPPSGGRVPSAPSTATATSTTTTSSSNNSGTTNTTTTTTASTSSHLGAASRWHAFTSLSSPLRSGALMMRVSTGADSESSLSQRAAPPPPLLLPRPPSKARLTATPTASSSAASTAAPHTTAGS